MPYTYTIDGHTYVPFNGSLLRLTETVSDLTEVEPNTLYLYNNKVVQFEERFDSDYVYFHQADPDQRRSVDQDPDTRFELFTEAVKLERVIPDNLVECPNCGSAAGDKEDRDSPLCFQCGYGTDEGLYENRSPE